MLDHKDGNGLNDNPANLRPATRAENARNIKSKKRKSSLPMGVRATTSGKYQARIMEAGRLVSLGSYDTIVAAHRAYISKRVEVFGEFA